MSRDFNGTSDGIDLGTFTVVPPCAWWCWTKRQGNGEGGLGALMGGGSAPGGGTFFRKAITGTNRIQVGLESPLSIVDAGALSADGVFPPDVWLFLAASFAAGDGGPRIWAGGPATTVAEVSYTSREDATLLDCEGIIDPDIGRHPTLPSMRYDGLIGHSGVMDGVPTAEQFDRLRIFTYATMHKFGTLTLKGYWPLSESVASVSLDHSGQERHGTVTGTTVAEEPPFVWTRRGVRAALRTPALLAAAGGFRSFASLWFGPDAGGAGGGVVTTASGRKLISQALAGTIQAELT